MTKGTPHKIPLIIGHRGASRDAPENTLESFRLAWEQGADGIEADFRLAADRRIVCMHDPTTGRTTGVDLNVADTPLESLRRLDAGHVKGEVWSGAMIPTLDEVLAALPGNSRLFIEIKSGAEIITHLGRVLQTSGISPDRIRLLSFSADLITKLKQLLPEWHACWLCDYRHSIVSDLWCPSRPDVLDTLRRTDADGLASADREFLDRDLVETLRKSGREIHVWTVDRPAAAERLCALGVDSIMTNRPGWLRRQLEGAPKP
ncbi:MAG: glycerophosphodiester phosphodiesterase family protein [Desulfuromonadaceae bacterium]|nr:glycerophosphodiester phosphodiesterase family protein [Desulfuromonadaceae bacterium]